MNLNGTWDYAVCSQDDGLPPEQFDGEILVPFPIESLLSGVHKPLQPDQALWYRRTFLLPEDWVDQQVLIHFGAVDFACKLWVNGQLVGEHKGGYLPFSFNITSVLRLGENEIVLRVTDPTDAGLQERGKQVLEPKSIWYTAVSGIWQTVWLEPVPDPFIQHIRVIPDVDENKFLVMVEVNETQEDLDLSLEINLLDGHEVASKTVCRPGEVAQLKLDQPKLWSPDSPFLYDLQMDLFMAGEQVDHVESYTALRKYSLIRDAKGLLRFAVNNEPIFLYGPLDQGYFPDGLYTPPSEAAMLYDIEITKELGFNLIRKHVKVEPARWYTYCDRLGMIVWQDMPNGGFPDKPWQATLSIALGYPRSDKRRLKRFGRHDPENRRFFEVQLEEMIHHLAHFACIAVWVPFNESWGQFQARRIANRVSDLDPTRLVDHASGWFDQGGGDFVSKHVYVKKLKTPKHIKNRAFVISEFGGYSLQLPGHTWDADRKFGYRFFEDSEALTKAYLTLIEEQLAPLIPEGLAAAIVTQTTDVEIEVNGFLTYDREVAKMDLKRIKEVHHKLLSGSLLE
jgi:beta-galactosidase/beta-glucuronidase